MHVAKDSIPAKIEVPDAVARQVTEFGDASGYGTMAGEYFTLGAGTDIAPLLKGLRKDSYHAPHWGYMISGGVVVTYADGKTETCRKNDLFYRPPGHTVRVVADADVVLPQREHVEVMDHMLGKMGGGA